MYIHSHLEAVEHHGCRMEALSDARDESHGPGDRYTHTHTHTYMYIDTHIHIYTHTIYIP